MDFNFRQELGKMTPRIAEGAKIYIFGTDGNWEYVCKQYRYLVNIDINEYVDGFIDNDTGKQGAIFHGKTVCALSEIDLRNSVVLISASSDKTNREIASQLANAGMYWRHSFFTGECFIVLLKRWEWLRLQKLRGRHTGERCFVIGSGPSLTAGDLDRLKDEITFATNSIYLMFPKTDWRPSYYVIEDSVRIKQSHRSIKEKVTCPIFYAAHSVFDIDEFSLLDGYFYYLDSSVAWKPDPSGQLAFSEDPLVWQWGATVTYSCLQLAVYMGFKEIYLIGIDNVFPLAVKNDGTLIMTDVAAHFTARYDDKTIYNYNCQIIDIVNAAYQTAREYADSHHIKIYNATRGGKLEAFKRVDFNALF